jgi:hypothetical protein
MKNAAAQGQFQRLTETRRARVSFTLDGQLRDALQGDTVMTAVLSQAWQLRVSEPKGDKRAGFCLMGACQDCWMLTESGERLRACTTFIVTGMRLLSQPKVPDEA